MFRPTLRVAAVAAAATLALSACGSSSTPTATEAASPSVKAAPITLTDGWCKSTDSMPEGKKDMTGCFGTLTNTGTEDIVLTDATAEVAGMIEMHETVKGANGMMQMQKAKDGFTLPAGGTFELKPGANHIMLMKLTKELQIGTQIPVVLKTAAGDVPLSFQARAFDAANETYVTP